MKNILILTDFSYCSEKAIEFGINLFGTEKATYTLLHAIHYRQFGASFSVNLSDEIRIYSEKKMNELVGSLTEKHKALKINGVVEFGGVVSTVQAASEKESWDCIVLGANGSSGAYEKILGSSANALLTEIDNNLLVVPVTAKEDEIDHAVFSMRITRKNMNDSLSKAIHLIGDRIDDLNLMSILNSPEETESAENIFNEWSQNKTPFKMQLSLYQNNGEHMENQIIRDAAENESDLLIINPNKDKSIWERIFDRNISKQVVERTYLPVLVIK